jgi:hypothetical protein
MEELDEVYCFNWYKEMYLREGCSEEIAKQRAMIDLNYQKSLYKMCDVFGVQEDLK